MNEIDERETTNGAEKKTSEYTKQKQFYYVCCYAHRNRNIIKLCDARVQTHSRQAHARIHKRKLITVRRRKKCWLETLNVCT